MSERAPARGSRVNSVGGREEGTSNERKGTEGKKRGRTGEDESHVSFLSFSRFRLVRYLQLTTGAEESSCGNWEERERRLLRFKRP